MYNFEYFTPTKVVFGRDAEAKVGQLVAEQNCKKYCSTMARAA